MCCRRPEGCRAAGVAAKAAMPKAATPKAAASEAREAAKAVVAPLVALRAPERGVCGWQTSRHGDQWRRGVEAPRAACARDASLASAWVVPTASSAGCDLLLASQLGQPDFFEPAATERIGVEPPRRAHEEHRLCAPEAPHAGTNVAT